MNIPKISALFETSLASSLSASGTTFTLVSATDRDGNALFNRYGFVIDEGSADEEFVIGTVSGTTVTIEYRGIDADAPNTEVTANKKAHSRGASVKITDYPIMGILRNILAGEATLPAPISYASGIGPVSGSDLADKEYVDSVAISGAGLASVTSAGLAEEATQAEIDADTAAGSVGRLFANPSTLATSKYGTRLPSADQKSALSSTTTPGSGNKYISQSDLQKSAELYAADAVGTDAYAITLSPVPAAYATGMVVNFKAGTVNTGAATVNVNGLGAKSILRPDGSALSDGDIAANQIVQVIYNGTSFLMLSPVANAPKYANGVTTHAGDSTVSQTIAHGLGRAPRLVKLTGIKTVSGSILAFSWGTYNGTTSSCVFGVNAATSASSNDSTNVIHMNDGSSNELSATVTVDATNITLTWSKLNTPNSNNINIMWEAQA